jgi:6-pyruvoyltetrahydropterin/6-carboxytetrahydropterin synthase
VIKDEVIEKVDHKNLNLDVDFMQGKMASCEIFAMEIWKVLASKLNAAIPNGNLHCLELIETNKNSVKYYGE